MSKTREHEDEARAPVDHISLKSMIQNLWSGKKTISFTTFAFLLASVWYSLSLPNVYSTFAILSVNADQASAGGLSRLAQQYGGLARLAGLDVGASTPQADKGKVALKKMQSFDFFNDSIYQEVVVDLFSVKGWDAVTGVLEYKPEVFDRESGTWIRQVAPPKTPKPSAQEAFKVFSGLFSANRDRLSGFISVNVSAPSPSLAREWGNLVISQINETIRKSDIKKAEDSIVFLQEQRAKTDISNLEGVFARLIEEQTKTIMLANVSKDYIFEVIERPVAPEQKSGPFRAQICFLGAFLGMLFGMLVVLVKEYLGKEAKIKS
tara:strand:+ start:932 stop:1894 length:963 start_codon:yes stop_codon:yes gene_type:complete